MAKVLLLWLVVVAVSGCSFTTARAKAHVGPGMTPAEVSDLLGKPDDRSFRESDEAWQYEDVVGFGQCEYITIWFSGGVVHAMTTRRGSSVAGCGLGSTTIDWGQMPEPPGIEIHQKVEVN